jgi:hypothetical protein
MLKLFLANALAKTVRTLLIRKVIVTMTLRKRRSLKSTKKIKRTKKTKSTKRKKRRRSRRKEPNLMTLVSTKMQETMIDKKDGFYRKGILGLAEAGLTSFTTFFPSVKSYLLGRLASKS